ncbi:hypothetical protein PILCRDRAFT_483171 [Piloderma croceum F 1598]|uniref:Uncharacterized protein n=1 Tax=Piloderma croceum (strain F 1598) TaxID=765440 RepID=A0A0C3FBG1_PILCF|nr:hypothetical protein PILCRDRAFT_483171 [Piloderma croceum F 1598]
MVLRAAASNSDSKAMLLDKRLVSTGQRSWWCFDRAKNERFSLRAHPSISITRRHGSRPSATDYSSRSFHCWAGTNVFEPSWCGEGSAGIHDLSVNALCCQCWSLSENEVTRGSGSAQVIISQSAIFLFLEATVDECVAPDRRCLLRQTGMMGAMRLRRVSIVFPACNSLPSRYCQTAER